MQVKKQQLELNMEQQTASKSGVHQGCILSPHLLNICGVHHVKCWAGRSTSWNQDCRENINNLRYADDTTLIEENEEELKSLLMKVKEESEKSDLKLSIQKTKIMALVLPLDGK